MRMGVCFIVARYLLIINFSIGMLLTCTGYYNSGECNAKKRIKTISLQNSRSLYNYDDG